MRIKTIIFAGDPSAIPAGLNELILKDQRLEIMAEPKSPQWLMDALGSFPCDLLVMGVCAGAKTEHLITLKDIRREHPSLNILAVCKSPEAEFFKEMMVLGIVSGYMLSEEVLEQWAPALESLLVGQRFVSPLVAAMLTGRHAGFSYDNVPAVDILTNREREVLVLIAKGLANKQMALQLEISIRTVEHHRANLTDKLGFKDAASLVKYAMANGLA